MLKDFEMSDNIKININKCLTALTLVIAAAAMIGAAYIGYDNAKTAKAETAALALRMTTLELDYAQFKGIMQERTKNIQDNVGKIYDIVKEWQPDNTNSKGLP
jgi:Flp pilus assembly protein TadB